MIDTYKFSTLEYKRPDLEARRAKLAEWKNAAVHAASYAALRALMFEIDRETCELFTQYSIAHIRHTLDTRDSIRNVSSWHYCLHWRYPSGFRGGGCCLRS